MTAGPRSAGYATALRGPVGMRLALRLSEVLCLRVRRSACGAKARRAALRVPPSRMREARVDARHFKDAARPEMQDKPRATIAAEVRSQVGQGEPPGASRTDAVNSAAPQA